MIIKVKLSEKGQVLIPKVIRDGIGLKGHALLEVKDSKVEIRPLPSVDAIKFAEEIAKKYGGNVSEWVYGDRLYEEEFKYEIH